MRFTSSTLNLSLLSIIFFTLWGAITPGQAASQEEDLGPPLYTQPSLQENTPLDPLKGRSSPSLEGPVEPLEQSSTQPEASAIIEEDSFKGISKEFLKKYMPDSYIKANPQPEEAPVDTLPPAKQDTISPLTLASQEQPLLTIELPPAEKTPAPKTSIPLLDSSQKSSSFTTSTRINYAAPQPVSEK